MDKDNREAKRGGGPSLEFKKGKGVETITRNDDIVTKLRKLPDSIKIEKTRDETVKDGIGVRHIECH